MLSIVGLKLHNLNSQIQEDNIYTIRDINDCSINEFRTSLSYETWDCVFSLKNNPDVDTLFNSFLNNYLRIFYNHFPQRKVIARHNYTPWMTQGIKTSCKHKRRLYLYTRNSNDMFLKRYYKQYCKILVKVIQDAKRLTYNNQIVNSTNKIKTTWNITCIRRETNRQKRPKNETNYTNSPEAFNNYFLTVSENIINSKRSNVITSDNCKN